MLLFIIFYEARSTRQVWRMWNVKARPSNDAAIFQLTPQKSLRALRYSQEKKTKGASAMSLSKLP